MSSTVDFLYKRFNMLLIYYFVLGTQLLRKRKQLDNNEFNKIALLRMKLLLLVDMILHRLK